MDHVRPARRALIGESIQIAVIYLSLTSLFFGVVSYFAGTSIRSADATSFVGHSSMVDAISGIVSFALVSLAVLKFRKQTMVCNIVVCFCISSIISVIDFLAVMHVYKAFYSTDGLDFSAKNNINGLFMCWSVFFGWSCAFLTILYGFDLRDRERRLAAVREEALTAQMTALQYQINPHFLFNTLNSIAGLIEEGSTTRAERMVVSLSKFLRTTLTLNPVEDVHLAEELALQEEYLSIEHERFSDRMALRIEVPDDVRHALVPSLILQPLIENAIKHGVGSTPDRVRIILSAWREFDRLLIVVENEMAARPNGRIPVGAGVGLRNVAERLRVRFNEEGRFSAGLAESGLFRATLDMPWRTS